MRRFGELVRTTRVRRGITQRQLADLSTLSVRAIRDIELGKATNPRRDSVRLIADGLGLTGRSRADFEAAAGHDVAIGGLSPARVGELAPPPAPLEEIVGREPEMAVLTELLGAGDRRLVTVTGLAAVGKTRLAAEVAGLLKDVDGLPVMWMSRSGPDHRQAAPATSAPPAQMLTASDEVLGELGRAIHDHAMLLVLDGYEATELPTNRLVGLLHDCKRLRILITSRAPLEIAGEWVLPLAPLRVPSRAESQDVAALKAVPSVRLLVRHARRVWPGFAVTAENADAVAALCAWLDGLPWALESVAGWLLVFELEALLEQVRADPFDLLGKADGPNLRRSLSRTVVALDEAEAWFLHRLTAAHGSWSLRDAAALTGMPLLDCARLARRLLVRGVVRHAPEDDARVTTLELIRRLLGPTAFTPADKEHRDHGPGSPAHATNRNGRVADVVAERCDL